MGRKMLVPVGGIYALVFSASAAASVIVWHSRLVLLLSVVGFIAAVFTSLLGFHWYKKESSDTERKAKTWFYQEPHFETFTTPPEVVKPPVQREVKKNPLDDDRTRNRLIGQRNLANAESAAKGERHNARILYSRGLKKNHLTDADVLESIEKEKGKGK
jgi:hypothetical protein